MEASEVAMIVGETVRACLKQFTLSPLLTIDEIAEKLKISKDAVRAYIRSGELKAYELGARLVRVEIAEVNEFLAKMSVRKDCEIARVQDCEVMEQKQEKEGEIVTEPEEKQEPEKDCESARSQECEVAEPEPEKDRESARSQECEVAELEPEKDCESARSQECEVAEPEPEKDRESARSQECEVAEPEKDRESARSQECEVAKPEKPEEDQGFIQCDAVHPKTGVRCTLEKGHEGKHCCRKEVAA